MGFPMRILILLFSLLLTACGGGGGSSSQTVAKPTPLIFYKTSYENMKAQPVDAINLGISDWWKYDAWAMGDFFKTGQLDVLVTSTNQFKFYTLNNGVYSNTYSMVGCLSPRKVLTVDFNLDGYLDFFVACHGVDVAPFPGEESYILINNRDGTFTATKTLEVDFFHGASAADVNKDGYPDVVVATGNSVYFYMNQGNGTFAKDTSRIINITLDKYYSVELVDIDEDGNYDLILGGHEVDVDPNIYNPTYILYGSMNGTFGNNNVIVPRVLNRGVVVDFTVVKNNNIKKLYVSRTSDSHSPEGSYNTKTLQVVDLSTMNSLVLLDTLDRWITWFVTKVSNNVQGVIDARGNTLY